MTGWDILTLSSVGKTIYLNTTDTHELKQLGEWLASRYGRKWGVHEMPRLSTYAAEYTSDSFEKIISPRKGKVYVLDVKYDLIRELRARGWAPTQQPGYFIRQSTPNANPPS